MATLYQLTDEYAELMARLEAAETEEDANAIWDELDALGGDLADKADAYARMMRHQVSVAKAFKAEKERMEKAEKAAENIANSLKARMLDTMKRLGAKDIQTSIGKWYTQKNPPSCKILDPTKVPSEWRVPQPDKIDTAGILRQYRATGEIPDGTDIKQELGIRFR